MTESGYDARGTNLSRSLMAHHVSQIAVRWEKLLLEKKPCCRESLVSLLLRVDSYDVSIHIKTAQMV